MEVTFEDVVSASDRLSGVAHKTPVLRSSTLDTQLGARLFLKGENYQRAGAFKFRGAYNAISRLNDVQKRAGVITFSSGNHAQAIALASRLLGVHATIVMPTDAPKLKLAGVQGYGAEVIEYDRFREDRSSIATELAQQRGLILIPPFDHPDVVAGQGTAAREFIEEVGELDLLFTPVGGGGLISGCSVAAKALLPGITIYGVEPQDGNDVQLAMRAGHRVRLDHVPDTIADGARTQQVGEITFPIIQRLVADIFTVEDIALVKAMRFLAERMKTYVEPTGCLALAVMSLPDVQEIVRGRRVGIILSGGNIDAAYFGELCR